MSHCPQCGRTSPPCPETGYDGEDFCSAECEDKYVDSSMAESLMFKNEVVRLLVKAIRGHAKKESESGTDSNSNTGN